MCRITAILLLVLGTWSTLRAQQDDPALSELLENFFRDNESASESDAQLFLERLDQLRQEPLDLNRVSREELRALQLLGDLQVEQFFLYRDRLGNLLNIYELQAVPLFELDDIRRIQPFVRVGNGGLDKRATSVYKGLWQGRNELLVRSGRNFPAQFIKDAEGEPYSYALRYRHQYDGRLRYGFTAENDAGEAFFAKSNPHGFDFYSAHLFIQNGDYARVKALALGDFTARLGQGLLLQTGFSPGKSAESVNSLLRGSRRLGPYSAFGEAYFLRGAGAIVRLSQHLDLQVFASYRRRDATVDTVDADTDEVRFSSILASGLHRTPNEVAKEGTITEQLAGASLTWSGRNGQLSANILQLHYDRPFEPSFRPYRRYGFTGQQLTGGSVDYQWRWGNRILFGETAISDNGGVSSLNGLLMPLDRKVTLAVLGRYFQPQYQAIYAAPFAEVSGASNEYGLYTGIEIRPSKPWKINAYADLWKHPWLRFGIDGPSAGNEYLTRVLWQPTRTFQAYFIWQHEQKQINAPAPEVGLADTKRDRLRLHTGYKISPAVELRSRVEWIWFGLNNDARRRGLLMYQEAVVKPRNLPLSTSLRYALFDTQDFATSVYAFENDLFSAVSIPGFSGRGSRFYINLSYRLRKNLRIEGRFETTYRDKAVTTGTSAGRQSEVRLQVRAGF